MKRYVTKMSNNIHDNVSYSTTRMLTQEQAKITNNHENKVASILFFPEDNGQKVEGGLRTEGYFKKSYENKPLISIITVVYNGEKYLEETIHSVFNQTYDNIEYIIIDGGSSDGTLDIIRKHEDVISYWVSEKDKGIYDAMNKGLQACSGEYVWFINAGDRIYETNIIENILHICCDADIFYGDNQLIDEHGEKVKVVRSPSAVTWKSFLHGMIVSHQAIIIRKSLVSLYDLQYKYVSDQDWVINALKKAEKICNVHAPLSKYLLGGFSDQNFNGCWNDKFKIVQKHYGFGGYLLTLWYYLIARAKLVVKKVLKKI